MYSRLCLFQISMVIYFDQLTMFLYYVSAISKFQTMNGFIDEISKDVYFQLNSDQQYLYQMGMSIQKRTSYL